MLVTSVECFCNDLAKYTTQSVHPLHLVI